MLLVLSDLHLGRAPAEASRAAERDAVALLEAWSGHLTAPEGGLVLLGDVFNAWMEYRAMVPRGFVRLQGALAALVDAGVPVTYVVGNRDPWHLAHFEHEVGVRLVRQALRLPVAGRTLWLAHGDGLAPAERTANRLRPLLRSALAYRLYRNALPGDWGFRLARWVGGRGRGEPEPAVVDGLRAAAASLLARGAADAVVFGHAHRAELTPLPGGAYLNPGYWFAERTVGVADAQGLRLLRWRHGAARPVCDLPWFAPRDAHRTSTETGTEFRNNADGPAVIRSDL